jgi:hypothetical protein
MNSNSNSSPKSTKSLGERLANVATKHKKVNQRTSLKAMLNKARETGAIRAPTVPLYQNLPMVSNTCVTQTPPPRVIKNNRGVFVKNPEYESYAKRCIAGGKRKTRKGKKSRRSTRRRR